MENYILNHFFLYRLTNSSETPLTLPLTFTTHHHCLIPPHTTTTQFDTYFHIKHEQFMYKYRHWCRILWNLTLIFHRKKMARHCVQNLTR